MILPVRLVPRHYSVFNPFCLKHLVWFLFPEWTRISGEGEREVMGALLPWVFTEGTGHSPRPSGGPAPCCAALAVKKFNVPRGAEICLPAILGITLHSDARSHPVYPIFLLMLQMFGRSYVSPKSFLFQIKHRQYSQPFFFRWDLYLSLHFPKPSPLNQSFVSPNHAQNRTKCSIFCMAFKEDS